MKKIICIVLFILLCLASYYVFKPSRTVITKDEKLLIKDKDVQVIATTKVQKKIVDSTDTIENLNTSAEVDQQLEQWEEELDKIEAQFNEKIYTLFIRELNLDEKTYKEYLSMRKGMGDDKIRAFESFHKEMEQKHGTSYTYNPTDEEIQFEKDIQKMYEKNLLLLLGKHNYIRYKEVRDRFNEDLMENQDPNKGVILMDF